MRPRPPDVSLLPPVILSLIRLSCGFSFQPFAVATPLLVAHGFSYMCVARAFVLSGIVTTAAAG
jgi:hypothetical protein